MEHTPQWTAMLDQLGAYAADHNDMPRRSSQPGVKSSVLSLWLWRQRRAYRLGKLSETQENLLRQYKGALPEPRQITDAELEGLAGGVSIHDVTITAEIQRGTSRERMRFTVDNSDLRAALTTEITHRLTSEAIDRAAAERQRNVPDEDISFD